MSKPIKTVLVTGIRGFLGRNLADLLRKNFEVYGLGTAGMNMDGITVFDSKQLDKISIDPDVIIMCHAAVVSGNTMLPANELFSVNVELTERICRRFPTSAHIYVSTASIYSDEVPVITENTSISPRSEYAVSKLWAEKIVLKQGSAVIIRYSSLYGNGMKENTIIPNYVNQALQNKTIQVWGKGERMQNYIHVTDASEFIEKIVVQLQDLKGKVLLGTSKKEYSNIELATIVAAETGAKIEFAKQDDSRSLHYNNGATTRMLNWSPGTDFKKGIENYIRWKKEQP